MPRGPGGFTDETGGGERNDLLRFIVEAHSVKLPEGGINGVDLDRVDIYSLMADLRATQTQGQGEVALAYKGGGSPYAPTPEAKGGDGDAESLPATVSLDSLLKPVAAAAGAPEAEAAPSTPLWGEGGGEGEGGGGAAADVDIDRGLEFPLPPLVSHLSADQVRECAYEMYVAQGGVQEEDEELEMWIQMEVGEDFHARTASMLSGLGEFDEGEAATMALPLRWLQEQRPDDFGTMKEFRKWQVRQLGLLYEGLEALAEAAGDGAREPTEHLRTCLGALDLRAPGDFSEPAYAAALEEAAIAAEAVAKNGRGGAIVYPRALRARLYMALLGACFDALEEGQLHEDHGAILTAVRGRCGPGLGVVGELATDDGDISHAAMYGWVLLSRHLETGEGDLLVASSHALGAIDAEAVARKGRAGEEAREVEELVGGETRRWAVGQLCDYHARWGEGGPDDAMEALLSLAALGCAGGGAAGGVGITTAIVLSTRARLERVAAGARGKAGTRGLAAQLGALAEGVQGFLREVEDLEPALVGAFPPALAYIAATAHDALGAEVTPLLPGINQGAGGLEDPALEAVGRLEAVEDTLHDMWAAAAEGEGGGEGEGEGEARHNRLGGSPSDAPLPAVGRWQLGQHLAPLLFEWVMSQVALMGQVAQRLVETETWARDRAADRSVMAPTGVELVRMINETLVQLFRLKLRVPVTVLRALTEGSDGALQAVGQGAVERLGPAEALAPPLPPLTRYKKDEFDKIAAHLDRAAAAAAAGGGGAAGAGGHADPPLLPPPKQSRVEKFKVLASKFKGADDKEEERTPRAKEDPVVTAKKEALEMRVSVQSVARLCCLLNTLSLLRDELPALERHIQASRRVQGGRHVQDAEGGWLSGLFDGAYQTLDACIGKAADYMACKVVFWDLRATFIEGLYRGGVMRGCKVDAVVAELDEALGGVMEMAVPGLHGRCAQALLRAVAQGWMRVVLDGGPSRLFIQRDAELLEDDLAAIKDFFLADGEGLSQAEVEEAAAQASGVLSLMGLETQLLVDNHREAEERAARGGAEGPAEMDAEVLLRVLCHREDRVASKYLKSKFHLPKAL